VLEFSVGLHRSEEGCVLRCHSALAFLSLRNVAPARPRRKPRPNSTSKTFVPGRFRPSGLGQRWPSLGGRSRTRASRRSRSSGTGARVGPHREGLSRRVPRILARTLPCNGSLRPGSPGDPSRRPPSGGRPGRRSSSRT
jgi:hypothetical protein